MSKMTSQERFRRMYEHRPADRVPIIDNFWTTTLKRWRREGMPEGVSPEDYFGLDKEVQIQPDNSPRLEHRVVEEAGRYKIVRNEWGATWKLFLEDDSTPEMLEVMCKTPDDWRKLKARMSPSRDRIQWDWLRENYPIWRKKGYWVQGVPWFGFDITHSRVVGTERLLIAMVEQPEWVMDMFQTELKLSLALLEMVWDAGYTFHGFAWPDDLGYKNAQFMSLAMYRDLVKPVHRRACDWAHAKGVKAYLHSCGNVNPFIPDFIDAGVDALNPLEVKAGMDPIALKRRYGDRLVLAGGVNAVLWDQPEAIAAEMRRVIPLLKRGGGYIFSSDHSIPDSVGLEDFRRIVALAKELGKY